MTIRHTTRRAILAGAAALPALTLPAIASDHPDAALLRLSGELREAHAAMIEAMDRCSESNGHLNAMKAPEIETPKPPAKYKHLWENEMCGSIDLLAREMPSHPFILWMRDTEPERTAAINASREAHAKALDESGYAEVQAEFDVLHEEMTDIFNEIMDTPAQSVVGMRVKVDAVYLFETEEDPGDAWISIAADIRTLAVGTAVQS